MFLEESKNNTFFESNNIFKLNTYMALKAEAYNITIICGMYIYCSSILI